MYFVLRLNYIMTYVRPNNRFTYSPILFCICIVKHFVLAEEGRDRKLMRYSIATRSAEGMKNVIYFLSIARGTDPLLSEMYKTEVGTLQYEGSGLLTTVCTFDASSPTIPKQDVPRLGFWDKTKINITDLDSSTSR